MLEVMDIESYPNIFTFVFRPVQKDRHILIFEISTRKDERKELIKHLNKEGLVLIGYNNVAFDYPILHYILTKPFFKLSELYQFVQEKLIGDSDYKIWDNQQKIQQIDLYLINHYDNAARRCSLKWLEFSLRWKKVQDLPFNPRLPIPEDRFDDLIDYNINDVDFTYYFLSLNLKAIQFRYKMSEKLDTNVLNFSDVKLGEYISQLTYEKLSQKVYGTFKNKRTYRKIIKLSDIIEKNIEFKTQYLRNFLSELKVKSFDETTGKDDIVDTYLSFANNSFKFAKGGLHSEDTPRIVKVKPGYILQEKDVASYYPASIVNNKLYPAHLGIEWYNGVSGMFNRRTNEIKPLMKKLDKKSVKYQELDVEQAGIKLALNGGIFGKLGSEYSWQYDPLQKYKITINCELKLLMLIEEFDLNDIIIHSANTDGVVIEYKLDQKPIVDKIHKEWEDKFGYVLEDTNYKQIVFSSVNHYIADIINFGENETLYFKYKGDFEIDKDYHKNNSQRIVPLAIKKYFIDGIPIAETIRNHKDIFDFCIGIKGTKEASYTLIKGNERIDIPDKVLRYYIANNAYNLYKIYNKGTLAAVSKGFKVEAFMDYKDIPDYNINYDYYINECRKIIDPIEIGTRKLSKPKDIQMSIFDIIKE